MQPEYARVRGLLSGIVQRPSPEDVASVIASSNSAVLVGSANAVLYVLATWPSFSPVLLTVWCASLLLINGLIFKRSRHARTITISHVSRRTARKLVILVVALALPWGVLAGLALRYGSDFDQTMAIIVCAGNLAGASFMLHRVLMACLAYYLAILVPMIVSSLAVDAERFWPIGAYGVLFGCFLVFSSRRNGDAARQHDNSVKQLSRTVRELETAYETISKLAFFDILTGLPNRKGFLQGLDDAMEAAAQTRRGFAILMLDLDRFKNVNDTLGHHYGDRLLAVVAERLTANLGKDDVLARLGGDEFAIIVHSARAPEDLEALALRLVGAVNHPAMVGKHEVYPATSIGGARYPEDSETSQQLLMHADISLNRAKETGRGCFVLFDDVIQMELDRRNWIEAELRLALDQRGIDMAYQPKVDLASGRIVGAEALVRWSHAEAGEIAPDEFLSVAAERGLITRMTRCIVMRVAEDLSGWRRAGLDVGKVAMNLHPLDLKSPADLMGCLDLFASEYVRPEDLILEITEGSIVGRGTDSTPLLLDSLTERGFELSLDDFGTGYASLSHLLKMPVREIKVDRSFIRGLMRSQADRAIISAAVEIARLMQLRIVAEGVESMEQAIALRALGISEAQGYYWSGPLDAAEFELIVRHGGFQNRLETGWRAG